MKYLLTIIYGVILTTVAYVVSEVTNESYETIAIPVLIGVVSAILAILTTEGER